MEEEKDFLNLPGVIEDYRTSGEKEKDWQAEEIAEFGGVEWVEKKPEEWRKFTIRNQANSSTCVAQTGAKMLGIENQLEENKFVDFSARDIYERRINKPEGGMWGTDALGIMTKHGATTEERLPSQMMSESQIEAPFTRTAEDIAIGLKYRSGGYVQLPFNIDAIASIIQNEKRGVMLFFYFKRDEWKDVPIVKYPNAQRSDSDVVRHAVTGVDVTLWKGEKAIVIEDSWGTFVGFKGQRVITESFLKKRIFFAGYVLPLKNEVPGLDVAKPKYTFNRALSFGMRNNADVRALQNILKFEGLFPSNVPSTGNYLQLTAKAVLEWQKKNAVASENELTRLQGRTIGPKTRAKLNSLYS